MTKTISRRTFFRGTAAGAGFFALASAATAAQKPIQGFEDTKSTTEKDRQWVPVSDRKVRVGLVGYGVCQFGAAFEFQNHPNVEVIAVSDLIPERCAELAKACRCEKTYPSLEEMVKDDRRSRPSSSPPMPRAMRGTASTCSSTASTWPRRPRRVRLISKMRTSCSRRSSRPG